MHKYSRRTILFRYFKHSWVIFGNICQSLSIFVDICQSLSIFVNLCQYLSIFVNICQYLSIFVNICKSLEFDCKGLTIAIRRKKGCYIGLKWRKYFSVNVTIERLSRRWSSRIRQCWILSVTRRTRGTSDTHEQESEYPSSILIVLGSHDHCSISYPRIPTRDPHTYTHRDRTARFDRLWRSRLAMLATSVYKYLLCRYAYLIRSP